MQKDEIRQANRKTLPEMPPVAVIWAIGGGVPGTPSAAGILPTGTVARDRIG